MKKGKFTNIHRVLFKYQVLCSYPSFEVGIIIVIPQLMKVEAWKRKVICLRSHRSVCLTLKAVFFHQPFHKNDAILNQNLCVHHYIKEKNCVWKSRVDHEDWQFSLQDALLWYHYHWLCSDDGPYLGDMMEMARWLSFHYLLPLTFLHSISSKHFWGTGKENT